MHLESLVCYYLFFNLFFFTLIKANTSCRKMEVAGLEKGQMGRDWRHGTSQVPGMSFIYLFTILTKTYAIGRQMEVAGRNG